MLSLLHCTIGCSPVCLFRKPGRAYMLALASLCSTQRSGDPGAHLVAFLCFSPSGFPTPCLQKEIAPMGFCIPRQGLARHARIILGSLVLLSLWFSFLPAFMPPVNAQAVERS